MSGNEDLVGSNRLFSWFSEDGYQEPSKYTAPWNGADPLSSGPLPYQLAIDGCRPDPTLPANCTTACRNISWLATSPYAIHACHTASYISTSLFSSSAEDPKIALDAYSVGIGVNTINLSSFLEPLASCFIGYCNSSTNTCSSGGHDCLVLSERSREITNGSVAALQDCIVRDICPNALTEVNSDLGGIGVYISYYIQLGICLSGFILLVLLALLRTFSCCSGRSSLVKRSRPNEPACSQSPLIRLRSSLIVGLMEFHRTQCFFALAINIASIVSMTTGRLQPKTLGQATANFTFVAAMAQNGLFCIAFLFWYLRCNLPRSRYNLFLTWTSFIVAVKALTISNSQFHLFGTAGLTPDLTYAACGFSNPTLPCYGSSYVSTPFRSLSYANEFTSSIGDLASAVFYCVLLNTTLLLLCFAEDYGSHLIRWIQQRLAKCNDRTRYLHAKLSEIYAKSRIPQSVSTLYGIGKVILIAGILEYMVLNLTILLSFATSSQIDMSSWSFGQIVAVTVWAQPIGASIQSYLHSLRRNKSRKVLESQQLHMGAPLIETLSQNTRSSQLRPTTSLVDKLSKLYQSVGDVLSCEPSIWGPSSAFEVSRRPSDIESVPENQPATEDVGASIELESRPLLLPRYTI